MSTADALPAMAPVSPGSWRMIFVATGRPVCGDPEHRHSGSCSLYRSGREVDAARKIERETKAAEAQSFAPLVVDARASIPRGPIAQPTLRGPSFSIDRLQADVAMEATRRWPNMTVVTEGLALAEEAGEVCRAILKRGEGTRGTPEEWTAELRKEIGQTIFVLLHIAAMEGWKASTLLEDQMAAFRAKPETEPMEGHQIGTFDSTGHLTLNSERTEVQHLAGFVPVTEAFVEPQTPRPAGRSSGCRCPGDDPTPPHASASCPLWGHE